MFARFMRFWAPPIAWILLIFVGSGDALSAEHTSRFIGPFLHWLLPSLAPGVVEHIHVGIRKCMHMAEYAILAFLLFRAISCDLKKERSGTRLLVAVWIACVFIAAGDEFRQSFVRSRGSSPWDVMIDSAGAAIGILVCSRVFHRRTPLAKAATEACSRN